MIKIVLTLLLAVSAGNALAANINIGPNGCTLGDAIKAANQDKAVGMCAKGSGVDSIIAPDGWVVTLNSDSPTITTSMTIRSATPAGTFTIDGDRQHRVLKITGLSTDVTLQNLRIRNGKVGEFQDAGAGIRIVDATVRLENSSVTGNEQHFRPNRGASGISVTDGDLTIDHCTVEGNLRATAIYSEGSSVHVIDSVFKANSGTIGSYHGSLLIEGSLVDQEEVSAAVFGHDAVVEITNSTFSPSIPAQVQGRNALSFYESSFITLSNVTMAQHFQLHDATLSVSNSLLAGCSLQSTNVVRDTGNLNQKDPNGGYGNASCMGHNPHNSSLLPLADNGGPTKTRAIASPGSPMINGGDPNYCEPTDQRGVARGATCDIGAYEASDAVDVVASGLIAVASPYASEQHVLVYARVRNDGNKVATNVLLDIDTNNAVITRVNSTYCTAIPCVIPSIQRDQTVEIPVEMTLSSYLSSSFSIDFSAHTTANSTYVDADEDDPSGNNFFHLSYPINKAANVGLGLYLTTPGPYYLGQTVAYQALIDNAGPQTASGVQLQFQPTHLNNITFSGCTSVSGNNCNVADMASGSSRTVHIQANIADEQFNAVGEVTADQVDIDLRNNLDDRNNGGGVTDANIKVQAKLLNAGPYYSYDYLEIEILISTGNAPASNIQVHYDFPGSEFINIQPCANYPCIIPQLAANSEITLLAQFFAPIAIPGVVETLDFHVEAWPGQRDPQPMNNEVTITKDLYPVADVGANLSLISTPPFYAGQVVQYALRVFNAGSNAANSVVVKALPGNLTLLSSYGDVCQTVPCGISRLNAFDQENITLLYRIDQVGAFDLSASVYATEHDNVPGNNTDSSNNGGTAIEPPIDDWIFADGFEYKPARGPRHGTSTSL